MVNINCIYEFNVEDCIKQSSINLSYGLKFNSALDENYFHNYFGFKVYEIDDRYGYGEGRYKNPKLNFVKFLREHC
jgi:hypothetical protein